MNPTVTELIHRMSQLEAQIAALQTDVTWLTRLFWWLFALSGVSVVMNGFFGLRNNRRKG